jgi:hypothetical protein
MLNKMKSFKGNKIFSKILLGIFAVFLFAGTSFASQTSVRLQQPKSPTNYDTFSITFVALDTNGSPVTTQCYKKGPSDGSFIAFGPAISLSAGGNTDVCQVNSGIINSTGTYQFQVTATGSDTVTSDTVNVDYNNASPETPINYDKTKPDNCTYKISFRTANDSGRTSRVALYRSSDPSFTADSSHQVANVDIGSDTDGSMTNSVSPNCDTTYYFVIRAFDIYGNGSGLTGDSNSTTNIVNATTTTTQAAIPVSGQTGAVLGEKTETTTETAKEVLGATESAEPSVSPEVVNMNSQNPASWIMTHKKISLSVFVILLAVAYIIYLRRQKKVE